MTKTRTKPLGESKDSIEPASATHVAVRPENRPGCPVTARAVAIMDCWTAHGGADGMNCHDRDTDARDDAFVIDEYRKTLEDLVTFERAGSIGGALFQIVVAALELDTLIGNLPDSVQAQAWREDRKIARLLESATAAIIATTDPDQLAAVMPAVRVYSSPDRMPAWRWQHRWPEYVAEGKANGTDETLVRRTGADGGRHA